MKTPLTSPKTITISNFSGRLTRFRNGDLNSGFAKFSNSWGYDPFSKPGNLTWLNQPDDIKGSSITDSVLDGIIVSPTTNEQYVYAIGDSSRFYKVDPTNSASTNTPLYDTPSLIGTFNNGITSIFAGQYGSDIEYYLSSFYVTGDKYYVRANTSGSVIGHASLTSQLYHPQVQFLGKLYMGNGNNIVEVDTTGIIVRGAVLSPALPAGLYIKDLDVTPDGAYMIITASYQYPENLTNTVARGVPYAVESFIFYWNGIDSGITLFERVGGFPVTALNSFSDHRYYFNQDSFGASLYEGKKKLMTMPNNVAPMPHGSAPNGEFLSWISAEGTGSPNSSNATYSNTYASLYYFGQLDAENPPGLWRMLRIAPSGGGVDDETFHAPLNMMVNNFTLYKQAVAGWGKHYISVHEINTDSGTSTYHLYRFVLPPAGNTSPCLGTYETQTQLFSKRIGTSQIRVYTEPMTAGTAFQIDMIGSDDAVLENGTYNYTFGDITDPQSGSSAVERINFNTNPKTQYGLGLRITNTGTTNFTIKKIEIDLSEEGK